MIPNCHWVRMLNYAQYVYFVFICHLTQANSHARVTLKITISLYIIIMEIICISVRTAFTVEEILWKYGVIRIHCMFVYTSTTWQTEHDLKCIASKMKWIHFDMHFVSRRWNKLSEQKGEFLARIKTKHLDSTFQKRSRKRSSNVPLTEKWYSGYSMEFPQG